MSDGLSAIIAEQTAMSAAAARMSLSASTTARSRASRH